MARAHEVTARDLAEAAIPAAGISELRLQVAVVRIDESADPYADVPCTD